LSQPFQVAEIFTGTKGQFVSLHDTIVGFRDIVAGKYDHIPENAFYMVGNMDTVLAKAEEIALEVAKSKASKSTVEETTTTDATGVVKKTSNKLSAEALLRPARPTASIERIRTRLHELAVQGKGRYIARAQGFASQPKTGNIAPGWNFPKEEAINARFAAWETLFNESTDIIGNIKAHFERSAVRVEKIRQQEAAEMGN